jgi:hypothetical protein
MIRNSLRACRNARLMVSVSLTILCLPTPALAGFRSLPDLVVATPAGNVRITDLKCNHVMGTLLVQGNVVNETNKSWDSLHLAMEFQD